MVRHLWLSGANCFIKCYFHHSSLVLKNGDGKSNILHSREGVMQGYTLDVVDYDIGVLSLIKRLKLAYSGVTQPWYADNAGALGTFDNLELYFNMLKHNGPEQGYYPNPTKIIMIVHPDNLEVGKLFGIYHGFKVYAVLCYLGGYIKDEESKREWLKY